MVRRWPPGVGSTSRRAARRLTASFRRFPSSPKPATSASASRVALGVKSERASSASRQSSPSCGSERAFEDALADFAFGLCQIIQHSARLKRQFDPRQHPLEDVGARVGGADDSVEVQPLEGARVVGLLCDPACDELVRLFVVHRSDVEVARGVVRDSLACGDERVAACARGEKVGARLFVVGRDGLEVVEHDERRRVGEETPDRLLFRPRRQLG